MTVDLDGPRHARPQAWHSRLCLAPRLSPKSWIRALGAGMTVLVLATATLSAVPAFAVQPGEQLADPAQEARARELGAELRCMVCQNQSIDDSDASLAKDLRVLVRERVKSGDSDEQVLEYLVSRYGEFVLLRPRFRGETLLLWGLAPAVLLFGLLGYAIWARGARRRPETAASLSETERARLDALLSEGGGASSGAGSRTKNAG